MMKKIGFCCLLLLMLAGCGSSSSTPAPGAISVSAQSDFGAAVADAKVFLNDVEKGTAPLEISNLSPGTYTLKLTSNVYKDYTASVVVQSSATTTVTATMEAKEAVPDASAVFTKQ